MDETFSPFHVPQQSRRLKLRYHQNDDVEIVVPNHHFLSPLQLQPTSSSSSVDPLMASTNLSLSSSTHTRPYLPSPMGPFTGYASILGRSRFLRPAQELLEEFSRASGVSLEKQSNYNVLEGSGILFSDDDDDVSLRCSNPNLVSMLHEVYKRYKLYCQQMQSAVTSFESVAGLGNATPFLCYAVKAMFRHFQCLKNAILDHIRATSKAFTSVDTRKDRTSGSCSDDKGSASNFLQHPVWRSQRGFPDKAVAVLRNWLFEHFLHPYPSDTDKHMLAQKTGLSRSQVSNWFTNARVRLWKPMVEEMHALEKKTQCSKAAEDSQNFFDLSSNQQMSLHPQLPEKDFQITYSHREDQDNTTSQCKRSRIEAFPSRMEHGKQEFSLLCNHLPSNQVLDVGASQTDVRLSHSSLANNQDNTPGLSWSSHGQIVPFWLAKQ
ncbi:BEL1-like homeodomain protein 9 [Amaranthus tricolor]|uniref:BEL1-like homeodomain protein 9 n=1 Tax=Amaranthus tricolor TaxID=29722 RepID=UPI00258712E7|nr:BEL1-like homeodomain protein 9 [Amaranthus tricolor]